MMKYRNVIYLFLQYFFKLGIPLATIPILSRTFSVEQFSINLTFQSIILWLSIIVEFGFIYTATRDIAQKKKIDFVISKVISAQIILYLFACIFMMLSVCFMKSIKGLWFEASISLLTLFFFSFTPNYIFHGLSDFKKITQFDVAGAIVFLLLVFIIYFLKLESAFYSLAAFAIGRMVTFFLCFYYLKNHFKTINISMRNGIQQIKVGAPSFLFKAGSSLYGSAAVIIMGASLPVKQVALYLAADRMVRAYQGLLGPFSQALYPILAKNQDAHKKSFNSVLFTQLFIGSIGVLSFYFFIETVILIFYGENFLYSADIAKVLIFIVPLIACSNMYGINGLLVNGFDKLFTKIILFCGILSIPASIFLLSLVGTLGMALSVVLTELTILILLRISYSKNI